MVTHHSNRLGEDSGNPKLLLKPEEAAEALGVGRTTVYGLISAGDLPSVRIGRCRRIPVDALTTYVERLSVARNTDERGAR